MGLYRQKGSKIWWISIYHNGKRIRKSTGTPDRRLSEKIYAKVKTQLVEGKWFDLDEAASRTSGELIERYLRERSTHKSPASQNRDKSCFKHILNFFGNCPLADITPRAVNEYKNMRLNQVDPQSVVKELGVLRNAFNVAIKEWEWVKDNPLAHISMPKVPPGRVRFITSEEVERLIEFADDWFKPVLIVAIHTGLRQGNIITLTWDKINLFQHMLLFDAKEMKNDEGLCIPMSDTLFETLKDLYKVRHVNSSLVFMRNGKPLYQTALNRALEKACKKAGIKDFRFHDLRHTFASLLIQSGVDLYTVQKLLGHKDSRMTQRYAHLANGELVKAVKALDKNSHNLVIVKGKGQRVTSANP
jgi:integrase